MGWSWGFSIVVWWFCVNIWQPISAIWFDASSFSYLSSSVQLLNCIYYIQCFPFHYCLVSNFSTSPLDCCWFIFVFFLKCFLAVIVLLFFKKRHNMGKEVWICWISSKKPDTVASLFGPLHLTLWKSLLTAFPNTLQTFWILLCRSEIQTRLRELAIVT